MFQFVSIILLCLFSGSALSADLFATNRGKYFVLIVWDGMRPDFVSAELTPNLFALRAGGVWFANHHSVYPTSTEVNGAALATGAYPRRNGIIANKEYRPAIDPLKPFGTESLAAVRLGDGLSGGKYLRVPTLAELVQAGGGKTAVVGAKPVALLHDRSARDASSSNPVWYAAGSLPESLQSTIVARLGHFPGSVSPNVNCDTWAMRCLTEVFWGNAMPRFSLLWLSEPDLSQHKFGPGSPQARAAIRNCDQRLAGVLAELDRRGIRSETDVLVVSDHGFSSIGENNNVAATLRAAGINIRSTWEQAPRQDDVVSVGNGGSVLLYVIGKSPGVIEKIVAVLQQRPTTGVIFTHAGIPGTFPLSAVMLDCAGAPDVIVASAWQLSVQTNDHQNVKVFNDGYLEYGAGGGMHVTLSPTDLHNTAIACGPDFRRGVESSLPSGNVDIVPTLLWLMDIKPPELPDGRVLSEALVATGPPLGKVLPGRLDARHAFQGGVWTQYLKYVELNGVRYLDEANGRWTAGSTLVQSTNKETVSDESPNPPQKN